jgi:hypothetical protein
MHEDTPEQPVPQRPPAECKLASSSQRQAILVLGMHRSGTSALGGVISALDVAGPKTLASANEWNPRGYFESPRIFAAHDELLASIGSCWDDWRQIDPQWFEAKAAPYRQAIKELLIDEFGDAPLIFLKDPRMCRFVPFVTSILTELAYSPVAVLPVRNPIEVAQSLYRRERFALSKSVLLWLRHVLDAEFYSRHTPRCFLSYEDLLTDWRREMDRVVEQTAIRWPDQSDRTGFEIDEFLTAELRHEKSSSSEICDHPSVVPSARDTYMTLMAIVANGESKELLDRLDLLRMQFDDACRTFGPAVADLEAARHRLVAERDELAADRDRLSSDYADLRSERDGLFTSPDGCVLSYDLLKTERDTLADDNAKLLAARHAMLASTSWRLTAPLRAMKQRAARAWFGRGGRRAGQ